MPDAQQKQQTTPGELMDKFSDGYNNRYQGPATVTGKPMKTWGKKSRRRKDQLARKAQEDEAHVDALFLKCGGQLSQNSLDREGVRALLSEVKREMTQDPAAEVKEELLDRIMVPFDGKPVAHHQLLPAVKRYRAMLQHDLNNALALQQLFDKHDSGRKSSAGERALTPEQLLALLKEMAQKEGVAAPSEVDVEFVIERCDADHSGTISINELEPAVLTWYESAKGSPAGAGALPAKKCVIS